MIQTYHFEASGLVLNRALGSVGLIDLLEAATDCIEVSHPNLPVLWDFRHGEINVPLEFLTAQIKAWVRVNRVFASTAKRAFLTKDDRQHDLVEQVLGRVSAPWPWAVFLDPVDAMHWLTTDLGGRVPRIA